MKILVLPVLVACGLCTLAVAKNALAEKPSAFTNQSKPVSAAVTILAVSSSSRQSFAGNREIYLADLKTKKGEHEFVRLIDQYQGYGLPIRDSLLRNATPLEMQVTREPECDVPGSTIYLAPKQAVVFNGSVRDTLQSHNAELVPCYKAIHQTIHIVAKK